MTMAHSPTINIDNVGSVLFECSSRAKRITISVRPNRGIRVAVPVHSSFKAALEFVNQKKLWIRKALARIQELEGQQKALADSFLTIDKAKAKQTLKSRLHYLASKYGFKYNKAFIKNQKTRWGSCSPRNNISLNMKLVLLPDEFIDYVILHELVHTKIHNHSMRFWGELDRYVNNGKVLASEPKKHKYSPLYLTGCLYGSYRT